MSSVHGICTISCLKLDGPDLIQGTSGVTPTGYDGAMIKQKMKLIYNSNSYVRCYFHMQIFPHALFGGKRTEETSPHLKVWKMFMTNEHSQFLWADFEKLFTVK